MTVRERLSVLLRRPWVTLSALVLIVLLGLAAFSLWLISTGSGLHFVWHQVDPMLNTAGIRIGAVEGELLGTPVLRDVRIVTGETDAQITIDRVQLEPVWAGLWHGELHLRRIVLATLDITLDGADSAPLDPANLRAPVLPTIRLPVSIRVDALLVEALRVKQRGESVFDGHLAAVLAADEAGLNLSSLSMSGTPWRVQARGFLPFTPQGALQWQTDWARVDDAEPLAGELKLAGRLEKIEFEHRLAQPFEFTARGSFEPEFGGAEPWNPAFQLAMSWTDRALPALREGVRVAAGSAQLQGHWLHYDIDLKTAITVVDGSSLPVALVARGRPGDMTLESLSIGDADTSALLTGDVSWRESPRVALDVVLNGLDPGRWVPDWPGRVGARLHLDAQAIGPDQTMQARLRIEALSGQLRGAGIAGGGQIEWQDGRLGFDALTLSSGRNRLELTGQVDGMAGNTPNMALRGHLTLPEPGTLLPGASGQLQTDFNANGTWPRLALDLQTRGDAIDWPEAGITVAKLNAAWRMRTGAERSQDSLDAHIAATGVRVAGTGIDRLSADLEGSLDTHRVDLDMRLPVGSDQVSISAQAEGTMPVGLDAWAGRITSLHLRSKALGEWHNRSAVATRVSGAVTSIERACLEQNKSAVCAGGQWRRDSGVQATAQIIALPLQRLLQAADALAGVQMPEAIADISANLNAEASIDGDRIEARIAPLKGRLRWRDPPLDFPETLPFTLRDAHYRSEQGHGTLKTVLEFDQRAHLDVALGHGTERDREALRGTVHAESADLAWLAAMLPGVRDVRGDLTLDARLGGHLAAPTVHVDGRLRVATATLGELGTRLEEAEVRVLSTPDAPSITLIGGARLSAPAQGDRPGRAGRLNLSGEVSADGQNLDLHLDGDTVPILRLADVYMDARPDLRFEQHGAKRRLSGEVLVPTVDVMIASAPASTLNVSPDEVIIGEGGVVDSAIALEPAPPPEPPLQGVAADVTVRLGDDVRIDAFDLKARLTGRVRVKLEKGREHAEGRIDITEGSYKAYGQRLTLARGHLMFAGPPDNPALDLRATRKSSDGQVVAHVDVGGNLHAPRLTVGTTPSGSDADALAYLLTGRPLNEAGKGGKIDVYAAALGLGLDKGAPQIAAIRREFGLDELGIDAGSGIEGTSVKLGKYLNPDLFIGYSLNVFDNTGAVLARLRLAEGLDLEGRSAQTQSVDLIYKIESD